MPAKFTRNKTLLLCLALLINLTLALRAAAQESERVVEKTSRKPTPLKVKVIKTKKAEVSLGKKFVDGDEDWFKVLSIVLENISGKTVTYVGVGFLFPRQVEDVGKAPPLYKSLFYGHHPNAPSEVTAKVQPLSLKPGETITVKVSEPDYFEIRNNLARLQYADNIKTIKFNLQEVYFDDGSGWVAGTWLPHAQNRPISYFREPQPATALPGNLFMLLSHSLRNCEQEYTLGFTKLKWQGTCTVQSEPPRGEPGQCGVYDGFYSRRCCDPD